MANYFETNYVVEGNKQDIDSFYEMMMKLKNAKRQVEPWSFGPTWLGYILEELGENPEEYNCKGEWLDLTREGDVIRFRAETAWEPCHNIRWLIEDKYPSLKFYFIGENSADEMFQKSDPEGKFFPENYYLWLYDGKDVNEEKKFITKEEAYKFISEKTGRNITNDEELETLQNELSAQQGACYIYEYE